MKYRSIHIALLTTIIILAATAIGCSGGGSSTSTVLKSTAPSVSAPASFIALASSNSVTLNWSLVSGVNSYRIYRMVTSPVTTAIPSLLVSGLSPTTTSYQDGSVIPGTTYFYVMTSIKGAVESVKSPEVSATPGSSAGTIQGTILYEDKEYGQGNFTGVTRWKPVRYADIDVVTVSNPSSVLYSTFTDSRGRYTVATSPSTTSVYVRVNSVATPTGSGSVSVRNMSSNLYGVPSDPFPLSVSAGVSIGISVANGVDGTFNILDVMTTGYDFVKDHNGFYPAVSLNTYFPNTQGTFFCYGVCPAGDGIYVLNIAGDTDQYDDDVLWHEFGHFLAYTYSVDQSEGGYHSLSDVDHDLRFSWSEGWGDFLPGAIKNWIAASDPARLSTVAGLSPTFYVDTPTFAFDFNSVSMSSQYSYASGEVAVAKVLHGMRSAFSMTDIWGIFRSFKDTPPLTPSNLELFWDRWLASNPTSSTTVQAIFAERQILYQPDTYENDDTLVTARTITVGIPQINHTLYADGDWDHVMFTPAVGIPYTIRTNNLRNGADTYLELRDNFGAIVRPNDNTSGSIYTPPFNCIVHPLYGCVYHENGNDLLGSTIQFTSAVTSTGPYTIRVYSSPMKPSSAGRYGTYDLNVTTP